MVNFIFILERRDRRPDELGRPAKQCTHQRADRGEATHRDDKAGDHTENYAPLIHGPRLERITDAEPARQ